MFIIFKSDALTHYGKTLGIALALSPNSTAITTIAQTFMYLVLPHIRNIPGYYSCPKDI